MRLTSLADYAAVMMAAAARHPAEARLSAALLAEETGVPLPTAQKLMGRLAGAGGGGDQPRRHHRGGRGADRDDQLRRGHAPSLRARAELPGEAAPFRGQ